MWRGSHLKISFPLVQFSCPRALAWFTLASVMDYLLFSLVLAAVIVACVMLICSAQKILARRHKRKSQEEQESSFKGQQSQPSVTSDLKINCFDYSGSFIEATKDYSSIREYTDTASNESIASSERYPLCLQDDSGIHEDEEEAHSCEDDSNNSGVRTNSDNKQMTLDSTLQSLDLSWMFQETDKEVEGNNFVSQFGFSDHHHLVKMDVSCGLEDTFTNTESELQDYSIIEIPQKCAINHESYSSFPTPSLLGLITKLSYLYCLKLQ